MNLTLLNDRYTPTDREECMALNVLHCWQDFPICGCALVPEHVERRPLFNANRPGLEQVIWNIATYHVESKLRISLGKRDRHTNLVVP